MKHLFSQGQKKIIHGILNNKNIEEYNFYTSVNLSDRHKRKRLKTKGDNQGKKLPSKMIKQVH